MPADGSRCLLVTGWPRRAEVRGRAQARTGTGRTVRRTVRRQARLTPTAATRAIHDRNLPTGSFRSGDDPGRPGGTRRPEERAEAMSRADMIGAQVSLGPDRSCSRRAEAVTPGRIGLLTVDERPLVAKRDRELVARDPVARGIAQAQDVQVRQRALSASDERRRADGDRQPAGCGRRPGARDPVAVGLGAERAIRLERDRVLVLVGGRNDALERRVPLGDRRKVPGRADEVGARTRRRGRRRCRRRGRDRRRLGVGVAVGFALGLEVAVAVGFGVAAGVAVDVAVGVGVGVGVAVGGAVVAAAAALEDGPGATPTTNVSVPPSFRVIVS